MIEQPYWATPREDWPSLADLVAEEREAAAFVPSSVEDRAALVVRIAELQRRVGESA